MSKQNNYHIDNSVFSCKGNLYIVHKNITISFFNRFWNANSSINKSPKQKKQVILKGDTYNILKRKWGNNEAEK